MGLRTGPLYCERGCNSPVYWPGVHLRVIDASAISTEDDTLGLGELLCPWPRLVLIACSCTWTTVTGGFSL